MIQITIVTIGWNDLEGLKKTMASLVDQTHRSVQHVLVDGGSTDGSAEWARQNKVFADTLVISEPDAGIFDAMNKGLARASGELIYFLNSGDCIAAADVLEMASQSYRESRWDWAYGLTQMVDETFIPTRRRAKASYSWRHKTFWQYDLSHQAVFMRTALLREFGGFDQRYTISADFHLLTRLGRTHAPVVWPSVVAFTLEGGASATSIAVTNWEHHKARSDALGMGQVFTIADAAWTGIPIAKAHARRLVREHLRLHRRLSISIDSRGLAGS